MTSIKNKNTKHASNILRIFNFLGGALIFFGIAYFITSNWRELNSFLKIFTTLGSALAAYLVAVLLAHDEKYSAASSAFFMIAGLIFPLGFWIFFDILNLNTNADLIHVLISSIVFGLFLGTNYFLQRDILRLFAVFFGSAFFIAATNLFFNNNQFAASHVYDYQFLVLGIVYFSLGYYLHLQRNELTGPLYFFGSAFILVGCFDLGGLLFFNTGTSFWEIIAPGLVLVSFMAAVPLRSKALLYNGSVFLVIYLASMTSLFAQIFGNLGWPLLLILAGLFLMLFGYLIVSIQRKIK